MPFKDPIKRREMSRLYNARFRDRNRDKMREYWRRKTRDYRVARPEYKKAQLDVWRAKNKEKLKAYQRKADQKRKHDPRRVASQHKYRANNPDKVQAGWERWKERNPERCIQVVRVCALRRYARKCAAPGSHTLDQWLQRVALYGWRCAYCKVELTVETLRKDHVKPLIAGGSDWPANLVPACGSCNSKKSRKRWIPRLP